MRKYSCHKTLHKCIWQISTLLPYLLVLSASLPSFSLISFLLFPFLFFFPSSLLTFLPTFPLAFLFFLPLFPTWSYFHSTFFLLGYFCISTNKQKINTLLPHSSASSWILSCQMSYTNVLKMLNPWRQQTHLSPFFFYFLIVVYPFQSSVLCLATKEKKKYFKLDNQHSSFFW